MIFLVIVSFLAGFVLLWLVMQKMMEKNGKQFLNLATTVLQPMKESIKLIDEHQRELEKSRAGAYVSLSKQIEGLAQSEKELRLETNRLVQSLQAPQIRGSWGEVHLRRVVELAGLLNHCDFYEQKTLERNRPDLIVRLPGQRTIAVDAKTPLTSYLEGKYQEHAAHLRRHIKELSVKEYWKQLDPAPEFVVLFLPAESFFSAALQADPALIEIGADQNIIVATPTTLIAILRAVAYNWKQETLSKSAREMARLGGELYDRVGIFLDHWNKVGKSLNGAVEAYNQSVASFESRVLVSARKLKESGSFGKDLPDVKPLSAVVSNHLESPHSVDSLP